jgi:hypothetical protein
MLNRCGVQCFLLPSDDLASLSHLKHKVHFLQIFNKKYAFELQWYGLVFAALCIGFIVFRFYLLQSSSQVIVWFDSVNMISISQESMWSKDFWFGNQPPFYPYFLKYFLNYTPEICCSSAIPGLIVEPANPLLSPQLFRFVVEYYALADIMVTQWIISVFSWIILALSLFQRLSQPLLRVFAAVVIFSLGCELSIVIWERNILTESLSISFMLLISSLLIKGFDKNSKALFIFLLVSFVLFVNLRVTHIYFLIFTTLWLLITLYRIKKFNWLIALVIFTSFFVFLNQYTLFSAKRSFIPIRSIVSSRIMSPGYEDIRSYFESNGMPSVPESIVGKLWHGPFADYPDLNEWINNDAGKLYQKYLITHPGYFFLKPFVRYNEANESLPDVFVPTLAWQTPTDHKGWNLFFTNEVLYLLILFPAIVGFRYVRKQELIVNTHLVSLGLFLMASGFLIALINWHADLVELNRHVLPSMLQIRLGILILLFGVFDLRFSDVISGWGVHRRFLWESDVVSTGKGGKQG